LILHDTTGEWAFMGETYAIMARNLASRFGTVSNLPVRSYTPGKMTNFTAVIYAGSTFDEPLPASFLTDVLAQKRPVLWLNHNIWQLTAASPSFLQDYGWMWWQYDSSSVTGVLYKGRSLARHPLETAGIMAYMSLDASRVQVLASAQRANGTSAPWAIRSRNLTYVGEMPLSYITERDRYLVLADLLFDLLAPATPERHRALVRIEDVGPDADPAELRAIADYLYSQAVPFSIAFYPSYRDPYGTYNDGRPVSIDIKKGDAVSTAVKYMIGKGGTLLSHGLTHQYEKLINPYDAVSGNDFEFFTAHVNTNTDAVILDGPVPADSTKWATDRIKKAQTLIANAGLPKPTIFEFPHYAASAIDYKACRTLYATRYERALYFPGLLSGGTIQYSRLFGQFFPYVVTDIYGSVVIPENIGNIEPEPYNQHPIRLPADLISYAAANLVVRDGFASFFYHPYLGTGYLAETVAGIKALGYTFVSPADALK
jgi:uncharacterized protein YdaL